MFIGRSIAEGERPGFGPEEFSRGGGGEPKVQRSTIRIGKGRARFGSARRCESNARAGNRARSELCSGALRSWESAQKAQPSRGCQTRDRHCRANPGKAEGSVCQEA